jgi:hypothetical protein
MRVWCQLRLRAGLGTSSNGASCFGLPPCVRGWCARPFVLRAIRRSTETLQCMERSLGTTEGMKNRFRRAKTGDGKAALHRRSGPWSRRATVQSEPGNRASGPAFSLWQAPDEGRTRGDRRHERHWARCLRQDGAGDEHLARGDQLTDRTVASARRHWPRSAPELEAQSNT